MAERLGLRLRVALFFAALAVGVIAAIVVALVLAHARYGLDGGGLVVAGLIAGFAVLGLVAWVGFLFDQNLARPILALAAELRTHASADVEAGIDQRQTQHLGPLAPAADAIRQALAEARAAQARAVAKETERINRDKALFEALLRDLAEAAIVLTPDNRIMLYNRVAQELLGPIGLDRPIGGFLRAEPLQHAIARLTAKRGRGEEETEQFLAATLDGARFLLGRVSPVGTGEGRIGHVLIFRDATDDLSAHAERDHLFNQLLEQVRRPAAAIGALLDALQDGLDLPAQTRATFSAAMQQEMSRLFDRLREAEANYSAAAARRWPMSEVAAEDIFDGLRSRHGSDLVVHGGQHFVRGDGFAIIGLLGAIFDGLKTDPERREFRLRAEPHDKEIWLAISWDGPQAPDGQLDEWVQGPVSGAYLGYTGRDVLEGHRTEVWSEGWGERNRIVLPLPAADAPRLLPTDSRPEFYDFNLPQEAGLGADLAARPLETLKFVVFDTETTGLSPRGGDEIVQIAGIRLVNGRLLTGETFDMLVNPGRPIPPGSTAVHHVTDAMVAGAPGIAEVGAKFHDFCQDAVLVAHNAPFDIAFLRIKEDQIGRQFTQPALCTVLLSAALFEHSGEHTLDALAERFGVEIPPEARHTAMGDAVATARIFLHMLALMKDRGIVTLGEAVEAGRRMKHIRRAQDY